MLPHSFRGPHRKVAGFRVSGGPLMGVNFVYLDEFGHIGPFMSRTHPRYRESPVFGLAGIILPETAVRPFATKFLQLKEYVFQREIAASGVISSHWEKKGIEIFTPKKVTKYAHFRATGFRLINYVRNCGGKIFYYGREKISGSTDVRPTGLYTTVMAHAIRQLENYCTTTGTTFVMVVDQHSAHEELLVTAEKTMYGQPGARHMISPPFEVESHLNQNIQAADWIAAIVGRLMAQDIRPAEYTDHAQFRAYFWQRIHQVATHSTILPRPKN